MFMAKTGTAITFRILYPPRVEVASYVAGSSKNVHDNELLYYN